MVNSGNKIVILTGPESTGKTFIAEYLARKFNGTYVPEFARNYIEHLDRPYNYNDILQIAQNQRNGFEKVVKSNTNSYWLIDTYLIITKIWFLWHAGKVPDWIDEAIEKTKNCLYLLCAPDIEWKADNVRENGGVKRLELFEAYKNELEKYNLSFQIVKGENVERFRNAVNFVEDFWG